MDQERQADVCIGCSLIVTLAMALGLFFGLLFPEIPKTGYTQTSCIVTNATILSRYCCYKTCSSCDSAYGAPQCGALLQRMQATPTTQEVTPQVCHDGFKCCFTHCDTCESCTTKDGKRTCTRYDCNCRCAVWTNALKCEAKCELCYSTRIRYQHSLGAAVITEDFGRNLAKAQERIAALSFDDPVRCYYPPGDPNKIIFSTEYDATAIWVTTCFGIMPLYLTLWVATIHYSRGNFVWASAFWGSIVPFIVFLGVWSATRNQTFLIVGCVWLAPFVAVMVHACMTRLPKAEEMLQAEAIPDMPTAQAEPILLAQATVVSGRQEQTQLEKM